MTATVRSAKVSGQMTPEYADQTPEQTPESPMEQELTSAFVRPKWVVAEPMLCVDTAELVRPARLDTSFA